MRKMLRQEKSVTLENLLLGGVAVVVEVEVTQGDGHRHPLAAVS
jgi:hypothetical protein